MIFIDCSFLFCFQSIVDLMDVLEQRKHEAILFTFKQVSSELPSYLKPQKKIVNLCVGNGYRSHPSDFR